MPRSSCVHWAVAMCLWYRISLGETGLVSMSMLDGGAETHIVWHGVVERTLL